MCVAHRPILCATYTMTELYSVDLRELSKPVKPKTERKRKLKEEAPASPPPTEKEPSEPEVKEEPVETAPPPPTEEKPSKKPKTEKQLAALERAREKRRLAKEEAEKVKAEEERKAFEAAVAKEAKLAAQREKRRLARQAKLNEQGEVAPEPVPQKGQVVKVRRSRMPPSDESEPPAWFKKYVESVKTEKSKLAEEKKPQKQIKEEAQQEAKVHWENGPTRSRVTHEVDNHMNRMYSMIFGQRRAMNA